MPCFATFTGRSDKGAGGGDIDAVAVATGANDVGKQVVRARERRGVFQQRGSGAGNFLRLLPRTLMLTSAAASCSGFTSPHDGGEQLVSCWLRVSARYSFSRIGWRVLVCSSFCSPGRVCSSSRALSGKDRFRMELEAHGPIVTHRHHHTVEIGVNRQPGGNIAADQRVVARHRSG